MSPLYVARSRQIAARELGGEMMIMSARNSTLFNLNELGTIIWQAADGTTSLEDIVANKVCPEYEVDPTEAFKDAEAFVRELMRHVLFFAQDEELVGAVFHTVCDFVRRVPVRRLVFTPDPRVWELIG